MGFVYDINLHMLILAMLAVKANPKGPRAIDQTSVFSTRTFSPEWEMEVVPAARLSKAKSKAA